ncbi:hypothetical protein EMIHUDRAFT_223420 [Emiliania huxleyi CCMP1516]|uniref:Cyclic nucleotide-binding domain-containing protein n=2 Tax=Emiliania huxleyi TaxID=2903 RepID=A0A0D3KVS3_EMIH1|nr:hypothetical protein EMIHUDRAFT_223420 [Emiliania huxleyi CCMP1516]EOD39858.1 hypothetical protein EMIHUDRAFT_223420 [Emiliania huxleyi CCMP1516]|eukprot:XP_005792287.1 hypothetical protein EMIHUDRAFT_223420 [Emiliania huxleyi CCMP1516]
MFSNEGAGFCEACPIGLSSVTGASECTPCGPGQAGEEGDCRRCPVGTWSDAVGLASRADCTPCPSGSFSDVLGAISNDTCTLCRTGMFSKEGAGACNACPAGSSSEPGASECTPCGPGRAGEEGVCRRCPAGTWSDAVSLTSRGDCSPCPSGSFSGVLGATSSSICTPCPAGSFAEDRGAGFCEACPAGSWSFGGASQCTDLLLPCAAIGALLAAGICWFARRAQRHRRLALAAAVRERDEERHRVRAAIHDASSLRYPFCVMPFSAFVAFGQLVPFEEARDKKVLTCCDTWDAAARFAANHPLIFLSHQWLSYVSPDPDNAHFEHMVGAVKALAAERCFDATDCYIWCDYHSIPQCNEATKALAVSSIALFAACTSHFVACVPETPHVDTTLLCNQDTYLSRGWCRLEQWAFMLANGTDAMFFCGADSGGGLQRIEDVSSWIEKSIMVFCGAFTNDGDKALLVGVVLGLYGLAYVSKLQRAKSAKSADVLWDQLQKHKAAIFPVQLFGDLVELLETELADAMAQASTTEFDLFDRQGFEEVLQASDRLYKQAMESLGNRAGSYPIP